MQCGSSLIHFGRAQLPKIANKITSNVNIFVKQNAITLGLLKFIKVLEQKCLGRYWISLNKYRIKMYTENTRQMEY